MDYSKLGLVLSGFALVTLGFVAALFFGTGCWRHEPGPLRRSFQYYRESPDKRFVAFTGRITGHMEHRETVLLAKSKDDRSTWVQLTSWSSYFYEDLEWTDNNVLRITGIHGRVQPTYFRLPECYGIRIEWNIREASTSK